MTLPLVHGDPCPGCSVPLVGLATRCWAGADGCGWTAGEGRKASDGAHDHIPDTRPEKEIEAGIIRDFRKLGFTVWKISQPRATMQTEGIPDLFVTGHGAATWGEIKRPGEDQSTDQRKFQLAVEAAGYTYTIWRGEDEAMAWAKAVLGRTAA